MEGFQLYVFFLCLIVFVSLTSLYAFMIFFIGMQKAQLITNGVEDEKIKEKIIKRLNKKQKKTDKILGIISKIFSITLCACLCVLLCVVGVSSYRGDGKVKNIPAIKVIASTSMSKRFENNKYLFENNITNQLQMFDVVLLHKLPEEEALKLYDIIVYEHISGSLLIHRIVGIEPPNEAHPDEYHFLLQGDAVHYPDTFPVRYSQMKSIYYGHRIPNIGSLVYFLQSPAGIICFILLVSSLILMPIADNYLLKKEYSRVLYLIKNKELEPEALMFYKQRKDADIYELEKALFPSAVECIQTQEPAIAPSEQLCADELAVVAEDKSLGITKRDFRSFAQKLEAASSVVKERYLAVSSLLLRIKGIRTIESKKQRTFKKGDLPIARLMFRGKTLCVLLGLETTKYQDSKYVFKDFSSVKAHANYPMCMRLTSDRQTRWTVGLINDMIASNNLELAEVIEHVEEAPVEQASVQIPQKTMRIRMSFGQRLRRSKKEVKKRYITVVDAIKSIENIKVIESEHFRTFRYKNKTLARITMKGKTLNVYLALNPNEFVNTKYIFIDASNVQKYANCPMRIKLSSDRQARWTCELIKILCAQNGILKED